jgi:hypothetical protein
MSAPSDPGWMEPELATLTRDRFSDPAWLYERKLDGERCLPADWLPGRLAAWPPGRRGG